MRLSTFRTLTLMIVAGISLALSAGCAGSKPANFYSLHSVQIAPPSVDGGNSMEGITIAIGPVVVPEYLDRPEIVTRSSQSTLEVAEFDRWAEPLAKSITRLMAEHLSILLGTDHIAPFPGSIPIEAQLQVAVEITQLDPQPDGMVLLGATWTIFGEGCQKVIIMRRSRLSASVDSPGYEGIASATSRTIEALSREIAGALRSCPVGTAG